MPKGVYVRKPRTEEHRQNLSKALKGRVFTEEWKRRMSEAGKGRITSEETRKKISESNKGKTTFLGRHHTEETKLKQRLAKLGNQNGLGYKHTEEDKQKMREAWKHREPSSEETRKRTAKANTGKKRTEETKQKMREGNNHYWFGKKGELHPGWKGGITPENRSIRTSLNLRNWRKKVYKRDYWTCQSCGKKKGIIIHAHHIKAFADYPELRFEISNGITYCEDCHKKTFKRKVLVA